MQLNASQAEQTCREISEKLKIASFLMTCLILCYHCHGYDEAYALGKIDSLFQKQIEYTFEQAGTIAMSYFFTVTGYLLFQNLSLNTYPEKIRRRFFSLFLPYLLWQSLYYATIMIIRPGSLPLSAFFTKTFCFEKWPLNGALWYVYAVFLLSLASPMLLLGFKTKKTGLVSTIVLILYIRYLGKTPPPLLNEIFRHRYLSNILYYLPSYLIGCYLGKFSRENTKNDVFLLFFILLGSAYFFNGFLPELLLQTTISLLPLIGLYALPLAPSLQNKKIYSLSFLIYAIHAPLLLNLEKLLWSDFILKLPVPISVRSILIRVLFLLLDISLAFFIHSTLKRICPKLLTAITGGRY